MNTQIDWREELDSSFGNGLDRPPTDFLVPGRAALRRRRTAMGAAALAGALVIGGIGWAVAPGQDGARSSDIATDPTATATSTPTEPTASRFVLSQPIDSQPMDVRPAEKMDQQYFEGESVPVTVVRDGNLAILDGWSVEEITVLEDSPWARAWSVSAAPAAGGDAVWMVIEWDRKSSSVTSAPAGQRFADFTDWMNTTWAEQQVDYAPPKAEAKVVDGTLVPSAGVSVLEQVEQPAGTEAYGPLEDLVAAKLRLADGSEVFALVTPDSTTTVEPAVLAAPTMAAFLDHLRSLGSSGEGVR